MSLNHYESRIHKAIHLHKEGFIENVVMNQSINVEGLYIDHKWKFTEKSSNTYIASTYFTNFDSPKQPPRTKPPKPEHLLGEYYAGILKAYIIDYFRKGNVKKSRIEANSNAKYILGYIEKYKIPLSKISRETLDSFYDFVDSRWNGRSKEHIASATCSFLEWCDENNFLQSKFRIHHPFYRDSLVSSKIENRNKKLPSDDCIKICGSIYNEVMPKLGDNVDLNGSIRDRFTSSMLAIAFASPNRMQAESFLIPNEKLNKKTIIVKGKTKEIHWINWQGSKGYKDNRNHILNQMAPFVERAIEWFSMACEPARVLCRFYENPKSKLSSILGPMKEINTHGLLLGKPVNIYQLGGILGLYPELNEHLFKIEGFPFKSDLNYVPTNNITKSSLFGLIHRDSIRFPIKFQREGANLKDLEDYWIEHIRSSIRSFPYRYSGSEGNKILLSAALVLFRGEQMGSSGAKFTFGGSPFSIESVDISEVFSKDLSGSKGKPSYFERNGFSNEFKLTPHQPRHFLNTLAHELRLSDVVIAHWSGRVSVNENATYDHTTDKQKHSRLIEIYDKDKINNVNLITAEEFESLTGKIATKMATGICAQPLHQSPCVYLSDCQEHCIGCNESNHIKGDNKAILLMESDLEVQKNRLLESPLKINLLSNPISKKWFDLHTKKVDMYCQLLALMQDENIPDGSIIRYEGYTLNFSISDLKSKTTRQVSIENSSPNALDSKNKKNDNPDPDILEMINLLDKYQ
jgi:hypothetical protein